MRLCKRSAALCTRLVRSEAGTAAIEFSIVLIFLLAILFGIIAFGFQLATRVALSYAVAEGGRSAVAGLTSAERQQRAQNAVIRVLTSFSPLVDPSLATVNVSSDGETPDGEAIMVSVTYNDNRYDIFPFVPILPSSYEVETTFLVADPSS